MKINVEYKISYLTQEFYENFPKDKYPEIERKSERPYIVFIVVINDNTFALPFRTNIIHNYCYKFKKTNRKTNNASGIDFTKAVIVNDKKYIGSEALIDKLEYKELIRKIYFIYKKFSNFVQGYIDMVNKSIKDEHIINKYKFSTLKYFNKELGLS